MSCSEELEGHVDAIYLDFFVSGLGFLRREICSSKHPASKHPKPPNSNSGSLKNWSETLDGKLYDINTNLQLKNKCVYTYIYTYIHVWLSIP